MTKVTFLLLLIALSVLFLYRFKIFALKKGVKTIRLTIVNYSFAILLIILLVLGFLIAPNTSDSFGQSNPMFESMSTNSNSSPSKPNQRPHKYFDINTY